MHVVALDTARVDAYLERLGAARPSHPSLQALTELHRVHLRTIPFENLSIHLGEPIVLEPTALADKLVRQRRGGFCYELNGAFASLLAALGFSVTMLEARVYDGHTPGPPFDHLTLRVDLEAPYLADVGFGDHFLAPLRLDGREPQADPAGTFLLRDAPDGVDLLRDGVAQYRLGLVPRRLEEFVGMCRHHQTSPTSHFTRRTVCSRATTAGRITISDRRLITTEHGSRHERTIEDDDELLRAYADRFGIRLRRLPRSVSEPARADTR